MALWSSAASAYEPWPENVVSWGNRAGSPAGAVAPGAAVEAECFDKIYVPATVRINTRGRVVSPETYSWEQENDQWRRVRHPAVYLQSRTVIEKDHFTLVPAACRNGRMPAWEMQDRGR